MVKYCSYFGQSYNTTFAGYQRELSYQRSDYSYSAFGNTDINGSTWLTALVVQSFQQAKPFIFIDDEKLQEAVKFLQSRQKKNGAFAENGAVHYKTLQVTSTTNQCFLFAIVHI